MQRWTQVRAANVVIKVTLVRDRYAFGEIAVMAIYRYRNGETQEGESHRVMLKPDRAQPMPRLWDVLFEEVLAVAQMEPRSLALQIDPAGMDGWYDRVETVVRLVAHELKVRVTQPAASLG